MAAVAIGRVATKFMISTSDEAARKPQTVKRQTDKVGRNAPCPCGSGKKYKKCHGRSAA